MLRRLIGPFAVVVSVIVLVAMDVAWSGRISPSRAECPNDRTCLPGTPGSGERPPHETPNIQTTAVQAPTTIIGPNVNSANVGPPAMNGNEGSGMSVQTPALPTGVYGCIYNCPTNPDAANGRQSPTAPAFALPQIPEAPRETHGAAEKPGSGLPVGESGGAVIVGSSPRTVWSTGNYTNSIVGKSWWGWAKCLAGTMGSGTIGAIGGAGAGIAVAGIPTVGIGAAPGAAVGFALGYVGGAGVGMASFC